MAIERAAVNSTITILRPGPPGPGGDFGTPITVASGLAAIYQTDHRNLRDVDGTEIVVTATFFIDGVDADGQALDIRARDLVAYSDWRGKALCKEIRFLAPGFDCENRIDHLEIGTL